MKPLVVCLVCLAMLLVALLASRLVRGLARQRHEGGAWPFVAQTPLSQVERILYDRLVQTLPDLVVLAQVPLSRFLRVRLGQPWREWQDRIGRKSIDFLICDRDFAIIAAIELDDRSHDRAARVRSDATKNRALAAAGIPLVRWRATALPGSGTIRALVDDIRRQRFGDVGAVTPKRQEPGAATSRVEASNDATMFNTEIGQ